MNAASPRCELLPWDSSFFGFRIARLHASRPDDDDIRAALVWAENEQIKCMYALIDAEHAPAARALAQARFDFVDVRLTLARDVRATAETTTFSFIRAADPSDRAALEALARASHHTTRFYSDGRFPREKCDALYGTWISQAMDDPDARVFVAEGPAIAGYLSLHDVDAAEAQIGLVAVDSAVQGRGFGRALVAHALEWLDDRGCGSVRVVTQGLRAASIRFYETCGFRARSSELWFHRWA
jgi:dTDP-4-amino-4,6-dideoxy-D-galactose acyltransferase